jgi:hypothetical protein
MLPGTDPPQTLPPNCQPHPQSLSVYVPSDPPSILHPYMSIVLGVTAAILLCLVMTLAKRIIVRFRLLPPWLEDRLGLAPRMGQLDGARCVCLASCALGAVACLMCVVLCNRRNVPSISIMNSPIPNPKPPPPTTPDANGVALVPRQRGVPPEVTARFPTYPYKPEQHACRLAATFAAAGLGAGEEGEDGGAAAGSGMATTTANPAGRAAAAAAGGRGGGDVEMGALAPSPSPSPSPPSAAASPSPASAGGEEPCCVVCLDEYEEGDLVRELPCRHLFHAECVDTWLKSHR